jgi:hypothetical protein
MAEFQIKRGLKTNLFDENGVCILPPEQLIDGCWYLTTDTAELYVAMSDDSGNITLHSLLSDAETFGQSVEYVSTYDNLPSIENGKIGVLYVVLDEDATYRWDADGYKCVGRDYREITMINGGTASKD